MKKSIMPLLAISLSISAYADTFTVDAQSNIFGAGHSTAPSPGGGGGGLLPSVFTFTAGNGQWVTFSNVSGSVNANNTQSSFTNGADGAGPAGSDTSTNLNSVGGISGIIDSTNSFFLVGVFVSDAEPQDPAPARLDFSPSGLGESFGSLSPQLNQTFLIGDGLTGHGTGQTQIFNVPATATRLYLGFTDGSFFTGDPGNYSDNSGSLSGTVTIVPEPSAVPLVAVGIFMFVSTGRTRRRGK
jgi:hypothetical protein